MSSIAKTTRILVSVRVFMRLLKKTAVSWAGNQPFGSSAIVAYYAIFSLPGLLVIVINLAGYFFGRERIINRISQQVQSMIGPDTADSVNTIIANASSSGDSTWATILGLATLTFGATGVFYQIQQILNRIWEVEPNKDKQFIVQLLIERLFSFGLVLTLGFLLLVSLIVSAVLGALADWVNQHFPMGTSQLFSLLDFCLSFGIIWVLFALIFRFIPDAEIAWRNVWTGAALTTALFMVAEFLISYYFSHADPASTYGAASSIILIMLWVSYSSMILLFGAEFTRKVADWRHDSIVPSKHAEMSEDASD